MPNSSIEFKIVDIEPNGIISARLTESLDGVEMIDYGTRQLEKGDTFRLDFHCDILSNREAVIVTGEG